MPPVVCRRIHVLFTMFGSYWPPVVCRRVHATSCLQEGTCLIYDVRFVFASSCLQEGTCHQLFVGGYMSYLRCSVRLCLQLFVGGYMSYLRCSVRLCLQLFVGGYMSPVVCRRVHVLFTCLFAHSVVQHILCCGFVLFFFPLVYPMFQVSLDFPFLIATSVFSNVYLRTCKFIMQLKTPSFGGQTIQ